MASERHKGRHDSVPDDSECAIVNVPICSQAVYTTGSHAQVLHIAIYDVSRAMNLVMGAERSCLSISEQAPKSKSRCSECFQNVTQRTENLSRMYSAQGKWHTWNASTTEDYSPCRSGTTLKRSIPRTTLKRSIPRTRK